MNVKTFSAGSMAEALALVKRHLGAHAVILHTRTFKRGGILGIGAKNVVEVTAADGREIGRRRGEASKQSPRAQKIAELRANRQPIRPLLPGVVPGVRDNVELASAPPMAGELIKKTYLAAKAELEAGQALAGLTATAVGAPTAPVSGVEPVVSIQPITPHTTELAEEMRAVRRLVQRMAHTQSLHSAPQAAQDNDALFQAYLALLEQEVAEELADEIIGEVRRSMGSGPGAAVRDDEACREAVRQRIKEMLPAGEMGCELKPTSDGRPRVIALVGPTGVGKTTTVAKLAATFKLKQNRSVALVTMDTYRIAAVDQLRTYANILGLPLEVVSDPAQMRAAIAKHADKDAVIIDSAGRSQRDDTKLTELAAMIGAADPHETHLVLSSTATQRVMIEIVERFAKIRTDHIIFTKLDEAVTFGTLLTVACSVKKRLSYITTGQEVPHQIEPGRADRLAALVLGESEVAR